MSRSRLVVDLSSSPANSRASSLRRSRGDKDIESSSANTVSYHSTAIRRTRSSAASTVASVNGDEEATDDLPPSSTTRSSIIAKGKGKGKATVSRASMSSISTANDYATSSGYSTPATSAVTTPAVLPKKENASSGPRPRGRPASSLANPLPPAALNAFQRAKNLRNSEFSLNPVVLKRKRFISEDEDGDDSDNSPDAQIAKALQDEENAKINTFLADDDITPRRGRRALRAIRPKADYASDFSDDEPEMKPLSLRGKSSFSGGPSNKASASRTKKPKIVEDSEESEFVISDSEDKISLSFGTRSSSEVPLASTSAAQKPANKATVAKQEMGSVRGRGNLSRGRGRFRGGSRTPNNRTGFTAASTIKTEDIQQINVNLTGNTSTPILSDDEGDELSRFEDFLNDWKTPDMSDTDSDDPTGLPGANLPRNIRRNVRFAQRWAERKAERRAALDRSRLEAHHPELLTMWKDLENLPAIKTDRAPQPANISRELKPFQLEGLSWMQAMERTAWGGGLLGDEMGMGKTIQAVSLIMSDYPAKNPSLVLIPPVALMQWQQEIGDYTDGTLKTFVFHGTNKTTKGMSVKELKKYDVILMSYNSLESMFRHQEKGFKRKDELHFQRSVIHQINFHRVILDEAHNIKTRTTGVAKACFALKADHKWCLSGTPLQNRIGEFFSLVRFLDIRPFACYFCKQCPCSTLEWTMNNDNRCTSCSHSGMQHVSVFNQELLNPIQKHGNKGPGKVAFGKLRLLTDRFMLRRVKRDHSSAMELPAKEIYVDRQFFGEEENDFAGSIMNNGTRKFETYVAQGVLLNNYANIFGLIMQMRQVADHPDLILKKNAEGGQNIIVCCICDETAEEAIRSTCRHDFCRSCAKNYLRSSDETNTQPDCPQCHIPLSIDLEQPEIEQDQQMVKKSSIINRIKMENWTSSSKIELLVYELHALRSHNSSSKSIIFSQFTTMLQLVEWRLRRAGITTVMLDGSMTPAQRQASINHFMSDVNVECFLVSLKAGGVALNLTEASKVFIVDPWWNPAAEWQSADRCHRIGQCRPCSITRLCIEDSVESRMVLLQEKKANMINSTINADDTAMESLTPEDMQFLFRGN